MKQLQQPIYFKNDLHVRLLGWLVDERVLLDELVVCGIVFNEDLKRGV